MYKFSVIMPIYNVEVYLEEAIESIVTQTIGFRDYVQLILVNDGSPDNSHIICEKYKLKYPDNILYIETENGGVSSARNRGIQVAEGEYLSFLDPDDHLSENVLENVFAFFEKNQVDLVSIPMFKFGAEVGEHLLNNKFFDHRDRVINIIEDYKAIQLSGPSSFFRKSAIQHVFDEDMKYAEDAIFVNQMIVSAGKYGALSKENKYFYRRRHDNSSATQSGQFDEDWYLGIIEKFFNPLIKLSTKKYGHLLKYVQNLIMYDLGWRLNVPQNDIMTDDFMERFFAKITQLIVDIEEEVMENQKHIHLHKRRYLLDLKNSFTGKKNELKKFNDDVILYDGSKSIAQLSTEQITIDFMNIENNFVVLEGHFDSLFHKNDIELFAQTESAATYLSVDMNRKAQNLRMLTIVVKEYKGFKISIPVEDFVNVRIFAKWRQVAVPLSMNFGEYSGISTQFNQNFTFIGDYGVLHRNSDTLTLTKKGNKFTELKKEFKVLQALTKTKQKTKIKASIARAGYQFKKIFKKKEKWVFMDRQEKAGDHAEHLFKYVTKNHKEIDAVFIIDKNADDFTRLKQYGKVIPLGSYQHKMEMLLADKVLSTQIDDWVINPFFTTKIYYQNLIKFKFVFLQDHMLKEDMSEQLNRYNKNMLVIMTNGEESYKTIIEKVEH